MFKDIDLDLLVRHPQNRLKPLRPHDLLTVQRVGLTEPVVVRPLPSSFANSPRYEILRGERWWRIAGLFGFGSVPAVIRPEISDEEARTIALLDDAGAEDPITEAEALQSLLDNGRMSITRLAQNLGRTRSSLSHLLRLLKLAPRVQALVRDGKVPAGVARALVTLPHATQIALAHEVAQFNLSAREIERRAGDSRRGPSIKVRGKTASVQPQTKSPDITQLETNLSDLLGCRVVIDDGMLSIQYHNLEILDGILERIGYRKKEEWD